MNSGELKEYTILVWAFHNFFWALQPEQDWAISCVSQAEIM